MYQMVTYLEALKTLGWLTFLQRYINARFMLLGDFHMELLSVGFVV